MPYPRLCAPVAAACGLWAALAALPAVAQQAVNATIHQAVNATAAAANATAAAMNATAGALDEAGDAAGTLAGALGGGPLGEAAQEGVKTLPQAGDMTGALFQVAGVLCLLLAVMFLGFWLLRRFGKRMGLGVFGAGDLRIEGTMSLGPKKSIVVVRFLNKRMVLGVTDASINLLTQVDTGHDTDRKDFDTALDEARAKDGGM